MKTCCMMVAGPFEKDYWREWAKWHHSLGFDDVFIVTNNWSLDQPIPDYVKTERLDGERIQFKAYNKFAFEHLWDYDWVAYFDGDEFLWLPEGHQNIQDWLLLSDVYRCPQCSFQWMMFGDGGSSQTSGSVLQRFQKAAGVYEQEVKSAISFKWCREHHFVPYCVNPHFFCAGGRWLPSVNFLINALMVGSAVKAIEGKQADIRMPFLAHFFTKTEEEWKTRRSVTRADNGELYDKSFFTRHNRNDVSWPYLAQRQLKLHT